MGNEQYSAWNRGVVENPEMMSALYFAASATSKHAATKKGKELEAEVKQFMLVSTLEDYNRAVQTLNVLQKSLYIIKSKNPKSKASTKMNRRGSNESVKMNRRGSNESTKSYNNRGSDHSSSSMDRMLAITGSANDVAPRPPMNELSEGELALKSGTSEEPSRSTSSTKSRKKMKPRGSKVSGTPHKIYKSKASMNILVAPPTPPTVKARRVSYKPGAPKPDMLEPPTPTKKSPKSRKSEFKPPSQISVDSSKASKISKSNEAKNKQKQNKESKHEEMSRSRSPAPIGCRRSSLSPSPGSRRLVDKKRSKSPKTSGERKSVSKSTKSDEERRKSRSKSPRSNSERSKSRSRSPKSNGELRSRNKSPRRIVDKIRTKSPRPAKKLLPNMTA